MSHQLNSYIAGFQGDVLMKIVWNCVTSQILLKNNIILSSETKLYRASNEMILGKLKHKRTHGSHGYFALKSGQSICYNIVTYLESEMLFQLFLSHIYFHSP